MLSSQIVEAIRSAAQYGRQVCSATPYSMTYFSVFRQTFPHILCIWRFSTLLEVRVRLMSVMSCVLVSVYWSHLVIMESSIPSWLRLLVSSIMSIGKYNRSLHQELYWTPGFSWSWTDDLRRWWSSRIRRCRSYWLILRYCIISRSWLSWLRWYGDHWFAFPDLPWRADVHEQHYGAERSRWSHWTPEWCRANSWQHF